MSYPIPIIGTRKPHPTHSLGPLRHTMISFASNDRFATVQECSCGAALITGGVGSAYWGDADGLILGWCSNVPYTREYYDERIRALEEQITRLKAARDALPETP